MRNFGATDPAGAEYSGRNEAYVLQGKLATSRAGSLLAPFGGHSESTRIQQLQYRTVLQIARCIDQRKRFNHR